MGQTMIKNQPSSYAEMFQRIMEEMRRQTDIYFEFKKREFDQYVESKIEGENTNPDE